MDVCLKAKGVVWESLEVDHAVQLREKPPRARRTADHTRENREEEGVILSEALHPRPAL